MAKNYYQVDNFYITELTNAVNLVVGTDGVLPLQTVPNVDDGKHFFVVFKVTDPSDRLVLPVYMDAGVVKYHGYDVVVNKNYYKYDEVGMNDVAEMFNALFEQIDNFGKIKAIGGLDINVIGGDYQIYMTGGSVSDTNITLNDNSTTTIIFNYDTGAFEGVSSLPSVGYKVLGTVITAGGAVTSVSQNYNFILENRFDEDFFVISTGNVSIKDGSITAQQIDFSTIDTDDIDEGASNLYFTDARVSANSDVAANTAARHTHANKTVLDSITNGDLADWDNAAMLAHSHANISVLNNLSDVGGDLYYNGLPVGSGGSGGSLGAGATGMLDTFVGDGVTTVFNLSSVPASSNSVFLFNDSGLFYIQGLDYTLSGGQITFASPLGAGREVKAIYFVGAGGYASAMQEQFVGDGVTAGYVLIETPISTNSFFVFNDSGEFLTNGVDYTLSGSTITFNPVISNGRIINIIYFYDDGSGGASGEINTMINLPGTGFGIYKQKVGVEFQMRRVRATGGITITQVGDELVFDGGASAPPGSGEANIGTNVGPGLGWYRGKNGIALEFKTLLGGDGIGLVDDIDSITVAVNEDELNPRLYRHFMN